MHSLGLHPALWNPGEWVIAKPGLWTMDCDMDCIMRAVRCSNEPQKCLGTYVGIVRLG